MAQKIILIGTPGAGKSALAIQSLKEQYGNDVILLTVEEANAQGLKPSDIANIPTYKIKPPPMMAHPTILGTMPTGREKRRARRKQNRKSNKKWK